MKYLSEYKPYIFLVLITMVLGYFLGITISSIVDYRLKDSIINLPKPKNNIIVKLNDESLLETFKSTKSKKDRSRSKKRRSKHKNLKDLSQKNTRKDNKQKKRSTKSKNKKKVSKVEKEGFTNFNSPIHDPNLKAYAELYNAKLNQPTPHQFKAANEESSAQYFQPIG